MHRNEAKGRGDVRGKCFVGEAGYRLALIESPVSREREQRDIRREIKRRGRDKEGKRDSCTSYECTFARRSVRKSEEATVARVKEKNEAERYASEKIERDIEKQIVLFSAFPRLGNSSRGGCCSRMNERTFAIYSARVSSGMLSLPSNEEQ